MTNHDTTAMARSAGLAPSLHNTQPWRFETTADGLEVYADRQRWAPSVDPEGRWLLMSCGAAVYNAAVTARASGQECAVTLGTEGHVASLRLGPDSEPSNGDIAQAEAVPLRHTMRQPFEARQVPDQVIARLRKAAEAEGAWLYVLQSQDEITELAVITTLAEADEQDDRSYEVELRSWLRAPGQPIADGIPLDALADHTTWVSDVPLRSFDSAPALTLDDAPPPPVDRPLLVVIGTDGDHENDWVRAGMAMQSLWLTATALGLAASPMTQALDKASSRAQLRHLVGVENGHPQILLRFGYGVAAAKTGRRTVEDTTRTAVSAGETA